MQTRNFFLLLILWCDRTITTTKFPEFDSITVSTKEDHEQARKFLDLAHDATRMFYFTNPILQKNEEEHHILTACNKLPDLIWRIKYPSNQCTKKEYEEVKQLFEQCISSSTKMIVKRHKNNFFPQLYDLYLAFLEEQAS